MNPQGKLTGDEPVGDVTGVTVRDFWAWAFSDLMGNRTRGVLAEFLVARALGLTEQPRVEWDSVDLRYGAWRIEVKTSAYVQTWQQQRPSTIQFDVARKRGWDSESNTSAPEPRRDADLYVFCVCQAEDAQPSSALDLGAWDFYPVTTGKLEAQLGAQKTAALSTVRRLAEPVGFAGLKLAIDRALGALSPR